MAELESDKPAVTWRRLGAAVTDVVVLSFLVAATIFAMASFRVDQAWATELAILAVLVLYEVALTWVSSGRSVGRLALRTRLVRESDLGAPSLAQCAARLATRILLFSGFVVFVSYEPDLIGVALLLVVELVMASVTPRRQTLADLVARTVVVDRNSALRNAV